MASLRTRTLKDGTPTYTVLFRSPDERGVKRQTSETFDTEKAAGDFMANIERHGPEIARRILDARDGSTKPLRTVAQLMGDYVANLSGITIGTRRMYERFTRKMADTELGNLPITAVKHSDVTAWIRDLEDEGLSGKTIANRHQLLAAAFKRAVLDDELRKNPATGAKIPRTETRAREFLTPAEFMQLYKAVPREHRALVHTLAGTGMRISEVLALKVSDLHLGTHRPRIDVHRTWVFTAGGPARTGAPKTEAGARSVSIGPDLVEHLQTHTAGKAPGDWVFTTADGSPMRYSAFSHQWNKWVKASELTKRPRVHDIRHSHVSWMLDAGMGLDRIQRRLGHASIKVTVDVYGHLLPDALDQMAAASDAALAGLIPRPVAGELTAG